MVSGKKLAVCLLVALMLLTAPKVALAAPQWLKDLGSAAARYVVVKEYFKYIDTHWSGHFLSEYRSSYGVSRDPAATAMLERVSGRVVAVVKAREGIRTPYSFFVNPQREINAFRGLGNVISLNQGLFTGLNWSEDEVAFIVAHECGHGQGQHLLQLVDKALSVQLVANIYTAKNHNNLSEIITLLASNQIVTRTVALPQEWDADNRAFGYATAAGYNPGAGAAGFVRIKAKYGDPGRSILGELISPSDHPTNSQRIANFAAKMTEYGRGQVAVTKGVVMVKGKPWLAPGAANGQYADERAYLIAGSLAGVFHAGKTLPAAYAKNGGVMLGNRLIVTPVAGEPSAEVLAAALNKINGT